MNPKTALVVLVCAFFATVMADPGTLFEDVTLFKDLCMRETNVTPDQLIKYNNQDPSVEKPIGCYADCMSRKLAFIKNDNSLDAEQVIQMLSTEFSPEKVDDFMKKCSNKIGKDKCEISLKWLECDEDIVKKVLS